MKKTNLIKAKHTSIILMTKHLQKYDFDKMISEGVSTIYIRKVQIIIIIC